MRTPAPRVNLSTLLSSDLSPRAARRAWPLLVLLHLALIAGAVFSTSNAFDETAYLAEGLLVLRNGDFARTAVRQPPLPEFAAAVPCLLLGCPTPPDHLPKDSQRSGFEFLYRGTRPPARLLVLGRLAMLVFPLALGLALFAWARRLWGAEAGLIALFAWAFHPSFLANGALVANDYALAAMSFCTLYALWRWQEAGETRWAALTGVFWGLALACKPPALLLAPALALGALLARRPAGERVRAALLACVCASATLASVYGGTDLAHWFRNVDNRLFQSSQHGFGTFFLGAMRPQGSPFFYAVSLLVKTPLGWLLAAAAAAAAFFRRGFPDRRALAPSLLFAVLLFLAASASRTQAGNRYLLPLYAAGCLWIGGLWQDRRRRPLLALGLLWSALSTMSVFPHPLSYANELVGTRGLRRVFGESDVDWGQDLPALARWQRRHPQARLTLCYFGLADTGMWGVRAQLLPIQPLQVMGANRELVHPVGPGREVLAMSATALQQHPLRELFSWDREGPGPVEDVGGSIFLWDVTERPDIHRRLALWYRAFGWSRHEARELAQAGALETPPAPRH
ncbi:MAG: glycosyltransferase family 39 protein [Elusimicrobiota bacterium]|jgi:4-amino-4-deoxy-L-arabinose transferase-like glycosyltransferase